MDEEQFRKHEICLKTFGLVLSAIATVALPLTLLLYSDHQDKERSRAVDERSKEIQKASVLRAETDAFYRRQSDLFSLLHNQDPVTQSETLAMFALTSPPIGYKGVWLTTLVEATEVVAHRILSLEAPLVEAQRVADNLTKVLRLLNDSKFDSSDPIKLAIEKLEVSKADRVTQRVAADKVDTSSLKCAEEGFAFFNPVKRDDFQLPSNIRRELSAECQKARDLIYEDAEKTKPHISPKGTHLWWNLINGTTCACRAETVAPSEMRRRGNP